MLSTPWYSVQGSDARMAIWSNTGLMQKTDQQAHCGFIVIAGWERLLFVESMINTLSISNYRDDLLNEKDGYS